MKIEVSKLKIYPADEIHEDYGDVLWLRMDEEGDPIEGEIGDYLSTFFEPYHWTHFARIDFNDVYEQMNGITLTDGKTETTIENFAADCAT